MKKYIPYIVVFLVGLLIGWLPKGRLQKETIVQRDTTYIRDTIVVEKPVLVERTSKETLLVAVHDTIRIKDTLFVPIPTETKIYKGEDYLAEISGYRVSLERIEVYPKTMYVTETIQKKDKRNYLSVGAEAVYIGTPYMPIYLEYERMLHKNFTIYARGMHDFISRENGVSVGVRAQIGW